MRRMKAVVALADALSLGDDLLDTGCLAWDDGLECCGVLKGVWVSKEELLNVGFAFGRGCNVVGGRRSGCVILPK